MFDEPVEVVADTFVGYVYAQCDGNVFLPFDGPVEVVSDDFEDRLPLHH